MIHKIIKVKDLLLDKENPRLPNIIDSEASIIEYMVSTEQVLAIMEDIADIGLSPIEGIAVIKSSSGYTVLEGNRRVSALKLLNNPNLLPAYSEKVNSILEKHDHEIAEVNCVVFNSRDEAKVWLERKHSGQQSGIGTKSWSAEQKTRFKGASSNNTLALNIIDFAKEKKIEEAHASGILTTVTRFLANETFRNSIGLKSLTKDSKITIDIPEENFKTILERFIVDVVDKTNKQVGSRANKDDVIKYGNYLQDSYLKDVERTEYHVVNPITVSDTPVEFDARSINDHNKDDSDLNKPNNEKHELPVYGKDKPDKEIKNRSSRDPNSRKYIFTNAFYCKTSNSLIKKIFHELKTIEVNSLPLSCALMTRTFIETILKQYLDIICGINKNKSKLDDVIHTIYKHLKSPENLKKISPAQESALGNLKLLTERKGYALSPFSLGVNAHGGSYPKATDIKTDWMNIEPIMQYLLDNIE